MRSLCRHHRLLRIALVALLALGMVIMPALGAVGDLHGVAHATATVADAHTHPDTHAHSHGDEPEAPSHHQHGDETDPDHTLGTHGLLHVFGGVSVTLPDAVVRLSPPPSFAPKLPQTLTPRLPGDVPNLPFRPPIA